MIPGITRRAGAAITSAGTRFVLLSPFAVNGHQSFSQSQQPALHMLAPATPVRDHDDRQMRVRNFRSSMSACPTSWRNYFEALAREMEREMN